MEGYVEKYRRDLREYEKIYMVLCPKKRLLVYFKNDDINELSRPLGKLSIENALVNVNDSESLEFQIIGMNEKLQIKVDSVAERNLWISSISELLYNQLTNVISGSENCLNILNEANTQLRDIETCVEIAPLYEQELNKFSQILDSIESDIEHIKLPSDTIDSHEDESNSDEEFLDCNTEIQCTPVIEQFKDDFDSCEYDVENEHIEEEFEMSTSIITHLISQVKIGMDLTKITLPTFILERRSLLEMFGDFFARPYNILDAVTKNHSKDRFIAVIKYYLGSFYPGRRIKVPKKPYNPILGETFLCFYKCDQQRKDSPFNTDGPLTWAKKCDFSVVAEQVSHHPPISAFYAECPSAKVSCNAHIYTKSRFLGVAVGVHNIGKGVLTLHSFNEDYEFTFPSGYARSILTTPWFELGGMCYLKCHQTGYHAEIEFLCKPFLNGKKHKIECNLYEPNIKKPFATITGEWNNIMYIKYADQDEKHIFIDSHSEPINRKYVKKLSEQQPNESRVIWKDVTCALEKKDIDSASASKHKIEEYQRQLAKTRVDKWQPIYFECVQDKVWNFRKPLSDRLN